MEKRRRDPSSFRNNADILTSVKLGSTPAYGLSIDYEPLKKRRLGSKDLGLNKGPEFGTLCCWS